MAILTTDPEAPDLTDRGLYPHWARDVLRYGDTDRQGHVNNAVFATFLETGRVAFLYDPSAPLAPEGASFVIARLELDFRAELHWPGAVDIGTGVVRVGRSSVTLVQGVFAGEACVATGRTVIVLTDAATGKAQPFPDASRAALDALALPGVAG
ncbi:MAG: thioesterase family protein [Azospirillaceae bacterium]